jgi:hypothetical protein
MWALSSHPRFTAEGRALLHNVATIADQLAALAPQVFTLQSVCGLFRIAADLLDGKPPEAGDVMGVNSFGRQLMSFMRVDGPLHRSKEMPGASRTEERQTVESSASKSGAGVSRTAADGVPAIAMPRHKPPVSIAAVEALPGEPKGVALPGPASTTLEIAYVEGVEPPLGAAPEVLTYAMPYAEDAAIRHIAAAHAPARVQWARLQTVPIHRSPRMRGHWDYFPLSEYRVPDIDMRNRVAGALFDMDGRRYISLEGYALEVRAFSEGDLWIVNERLGFDRLSGVGDRYPPLPLRQDGERWALQRPRIDRVDSDVPVEVGRDGFYRYRNRKYVTLAGERVEVPRASIEGEQAIVQWAHPLTEALPGADAMQIIRLPDGSHWIEGNVGYYRLRFDLDLHEFYVTDARDTGAGNKVLVDFDVARRQWTALVERRNSGYANERQPDEMTVGAPVPDSGEAVLEQDNTVPEPANPIDREPAARVPFREGELPETPLDWTEADGVDIDGDLYASLEQFAEDPLNLPLERAEGREGGPSPQGAGEREGLPVFETSRTGLEREFALFAHYAQYLKHFAFFTSPQAAPHISLRRTLRRRLRVAFQGLEATAMVAVNRMEPYARRAFTPVVLHLRRRINALYPSESRWHLMTIQEKQAEVALMVRIAYRETRSAMWPCLVGYCNEIADLALYTLTARKPTLRRHVLQVALRDDDGIRCTHVMLVYADEPAAFDVFGDFSTQDIATQRTRPSLDEPAFCDWLLQNRDSVLLVDAWSTNKILDLTRAETTIDVRGALLPNLMEAGFDIYDMPRFKVRALLPERPKTTAP